MIKCTKCKKTKQDKDFPPAPRKSNGLGSWCRSCGAKASSEWNKAHPEAFRKHLKEYAFKKQGIDLTCDDYYKLLRSQKCLCKICGKPEIVKSRGGSLRELSVDHNHHTGKVRGLLCVRCNNALGLLKADDFGTMNLEAAIRYLKTG